MSTLPTMTHLQRVARAQAKSDTLLKFLGSGEVFTTASVAAILWGLDTSNAAATLKRLETQRLLQSELREVGGQSMRIFGITPHGLALADCYDNPYHEVGRTTGGGLAHRLAGQVMRINAESAGWTAWHPERIVRLEKSLKKIPDAVATDPAGSRIAIEVERNIKKQKQYADIIVAYLLEIKAGKYSEVHYVCPPGTEKLVEKSFSRIASVKFNGETVALEAKHRARFKFFSFDNWPPIPAESEVTK